MAAFAPSQAAEVVQSTKKRKKRSKAQKLCPACSQEHFLQYCPLFKSWTVAVRKKHVLEWKLCQNCFRSHMLKDCPYGACHQCVPRIWRNSLLCNAQEARARQCVNVQAQSAESIPMAKLGASRQSPVMRSAVATAFRRVGWSSPEEWPLPDPAIRLNLPATGDFPPLRSLPQFSDWERTMRRHPTASQYMPPQQSAAVPNAGDNAQPAVAHGAEPPVERMEIESADAIEQAVHSQENHDLKASLQPAQVASAQNAQTSQQFGTVQPTHVDELASLADKQPQAAVEVLHEQNGSAPPSMEKLSTVQPGG